jgi:hypothetical protein
MKYLYSKQCLVVYLTLLFAPLIAFGQESSFAEKFQEANRLDEETELGQSYLVWTQLAAENPLNANVNYKAGKAYLQSYNKKSASLPFLERAAKGEITRNYDPFSPFEKKVPVEVYYYYAKALHLNYKLEKAEEYYEKFMVEAPAKHFLWPVANLGLDQVGNAKLLMKEPVEFEITNLGSTINTIFPEYSPVISVDENALFFTSQRIRPDSSNATTTDKATGYYIEDIYVSYKNREGAWQEPELLSINTVSASATVNVSADGQTLYIYKDVDGVGGIYYSKLVGETWSEPEAMGSPINSSDWEPHLTVTPDERTIYFVSNRKKGLGGRDIYQVNMLPDGKWGEPINLGPTINTPYEEDGVFISPDGQTLYFSSEGHQSMGGFDVFYSRLGEDGNWSTPVNLGYPINTTDDDVFFVTSADGKRAYYSSERDEGYGEKDIYMISLPDPQEVRVAVLKGTVVPAEGEELPDDITIHLTDGTTSETQIFTPRARDGSFLAILKPCNNYRVDYKVNGNTIARDTFDIACEGSYMEIYKELILRPLGEEEGVAIASTSGTEVPATFFKYFGYNQGAVKSEEELFAKFMTSLQKKVEAGRKVEVEIVGSASKVPTSSYKNNQALADERAQNGKKRILSSLKDYGIDPKMIEFKRVEGKVQGPEYTGDAKKAQEKYKPFQYIDIKAK